MSWSTLTTPLAFAATAILTLVFFYLYRQNKARYLAFWTLGLAANTLRDLLEFVYPEPTTALVAGQLTFLLNGAFIFWGTRESVGKKAPRWLFYGMLAGSVWIVAGAAVDLPFFWVSLPPSLLTGATQIWAGSTFLRWSEGSGIGRRLAGGTLILWGLHKIDYPILRPLAWAAPWGFLLSAGLEILFAVGMLMVSFEWTSQRLARIFDASPGPIAISTLAEGRFVEVNRSCLKAFGYERDEVLGRTADELNLWVDEQERERVRRAVSGPLPLSGFEARFRTKDGRERVGLFAFETITSDGEALLLATMEDVTDRRQAEEALRRYQVLSEQTRDLIVFVALDGRILEANEAAGNAFGYSREELLSLKIQDLWAPGTVSQNRIQLEEACAGGILFETSYRRRDGSVFPAEVSSRGLTIEGQKVVASIIWETTERKRAEREIRYLSFHDKLTGLYNRAFFEEEAQRLCTDRQRPLSLILGDVNGLKLVNDAFGHQRGDELLRRMARVLRGACRKEDVVARWGGDEFLILLPRTPQDVAMAICDRIASSCAELTLGPIPLSISLGVATATGPGEEFPQLLREAEDRMYRRKLLESRSAQSSLISSLGKALWESSHETEEHAERLGRMAGQFGAALGLSPSQLDELSLLAALHDIGKVGIPSTIREKPGPLTPDEWETMKKHPEIGSRIVQAAPNLAGIADAILAHHERWDGTGYPQGLKGTAIPLAARVLTIVDSFDVMTHERPYKTAQSVDHALAELERCAGTQFDPELVQVFLATFGRSEARAEPAASSEAGQKAPCPGCQEGGASGFHPAPRGPSHPRIPSTDAQRLADVDDVCRQVVQPHQLFHGGAEPPGDTEQGVAGLDHIGPAR